MRPNVELDNAASYVHEVGPEHFLCSHDSRHREGTTDQRRRYRGSSVIVFEAYRDKCGEEGSLPMLR